MQLRFLSLNPKIFITLTTCPLFANFDKLWSHSDTPQINYLIWKLSDFITSIERLIQTFEYQKIIHSSLKARIKNTFHFYT